MGSRSCFHNSSSHSNGWKGENKSEIFFYWEFLKLGLASPPLHCNCRKSRLKPLSGDKIYEHTWQTVTGPVIFSHSGVKLESHQATPWQRKSWTHTPASLRGSRNDCWHSERWNNSWWSGRVCSRILRHNSSPLSYLTHLAIYIRPHPAAN